MPDLVFNTALGRVAELYNHVQANVIAASGLYVVAINAGAATDATLRDYDTLAAVLGDVDVTEANNTGYARKALTDADLDPLTPDDVNDRMDADIPDQTWAGVLADGTPNAWTDLLVCYVPDIGLPSADSAILPLTLHDFAVTPDGSDIVAQINAAGFYQAESTVI